jgi:hypothetical protein
MKCSPRRTFLQPLICAWLRVGRSKVYMGKSKMMYGITYFKGFGQIEYLMVVRSMVVRLMVVCSIVHLTTSFKFWMTKN